MEVCNICPRKCNVPRPGGFCKMPEKALIARAELHYGEEPCISGKEGSGTIFFCGCNLRCVFCQNREISRGDFSDTVMADGEKLAEIMKLLQTSGANNINFVTPSHYAHIINEALDKFQPSIPTVWNSSGYDSLEELEMLRGKINIFLPDLKYTDDKLSEKYSGAKNYFLTASKAIEKMYDIAGEVKYNEKGMLAGGLIIRHLVLPNNLENTKSVIDYVYDTFPRNKILFSLMGQYTPPKDEVFSEKYPEISEKLTKEEYEEAASYFNKRKLNGFLQYPDSSGEEYIPNFGSKFVMHGN